MTETGDFTQELEDLNERIQKKTFNGREYVIQCTDPYGAWIVKKMGSGGRIPEELKQNYTQTYTIWGAIEAYENKNKVKLDEAQAKKASKVKTIEL